MNNIIIRADYSTLQEIAQYFAEEQQRIRAIQANIEEQVRRLHAGGWDSVSADIWFTMVGRDVMPGITRLEAALGQAEQTTLEIIRLLKSAEEAAATHLSTRETDTTPEDSFACRDPNPTPAPPPPEPPFNPDTPILTLSLQETSAMCDEPHIMQLVVVDGRSLSQAACEDFFAIFDAQEHGLTYRELFGILLYTELEGIRTSEAPNAREVYNMAKEALARQYYQLVGSQGIFNTETLFKFLGGLEGWYGHHPTEMIGGSRFPLAWLRDVMRAGEWVESPHVVRTEFRERFAIRAILNARDGADYIWDRDQWNGEDWSRGYGDCSQPARWGNVANLSGNELSYIETSPSGPYRYFVVLPAPGC